MGDLEHLDCPDDAVKVDHGLLPEDRLRQLGRSLPTIILNDRDADENPPPEIQQLRLDLLYTAKCGHLSPGHGAAALNTLCHFLEIASTSPKKSWSSLCYSVSTCTDLMHILLDKSENFKAKPTKQLLVTLSNILAAYPDQFVKKQFIHSIVSRCVKSLIKQEDAKSIKTSMNILEHLMKRNIIDAEDILLASLTDRSSPPNSTHKISVEHTPSSLRPEIEDFITHVLGWMRYPDCASALSRFLPSFLASLDVFPTTKLPRHASTGDSPEVPYWIEPVRRLLRREIRLIDSFEDHLLPKVICLSIWDAKSFLKTLPFDDLRRGHSVHVSDVDIHLCLVASRVMTSNPGLIDAGPYNVLQINVPDLDALCINLIDHSTANIRIAALTFLISSFKTTAPFPSRILMCLRHCIPNFHQETDPKIRNEFVALIKRLCARLSGAAKQISRFSATPSKSSNGMIGADENLKDHVDMIRWYQQYLWHSLRPTASYQSHVTALKIVSLVFRDSTLCEFFLSDRQYPANGDQYEERSYEKHVFSYLRPLLDLLADPFDAIRLSASENLSHLQPLIVSTKRRKGGILPSKDIIFTETFLVKVVHQVEIAIVRATQDLQRSGRADHADGLGRLYDFYFSLSRIDSCATSLKDKSPFNSILHILEQSLQAVGEELSSDFLSYPLHGHLISLRHIISRADFLRSVQQDLGSLSVEDVFSRLLACCHKVWDVVHSALCCDAPEGRLIYDDEEDDDGPDHKSKDKLSYCWRALKESSLLMRAVIEHGMISKDGASSKLHEYDYRVYGKLILTQLVELRHRGAFSTVAQTFAAWCIVCSRSKLSKVNGLPKNWYQEALARIQMQASDLTRRSAGLPALLTGILAAYPSGPFFDDVILDLQAVADAPIEEPKAPVELRLPQVHALNCLKDIFTDASFGASTEDHIELSLGIAVSSLECNIWAIRNCGLMLLQALLKRLNGGADTASTRVASLYRRNSPLVYERFPILPKLLLRLLRHQNYHVSSALQAQKIFPALEIIERFGVPKRHGEDIWQGLMQYRANPVWLIREKAARANGMIIDSNTLEEQVQNLVGSSHDSSLNEIHGNLMTLRVLFARATPFGFDSPKAQNNNLFTLLFKMVDKYVTEDSCPIIVAAILDIVTDTVDGLKSPKETFNLKEDVDRIYQRIQGRQANGALLASLWNSANVSESTPVSRCLQSLERTLRIRGVPDAEHGANELVKRHFHPKSTLNILYDGTKRATSGPEQSDENLSIWGGQVAHSFLETAGMATHLTPWIRALSLAMNPYSEVSTRLAAVASLHTFCLAILGFKSDTSVKEIPVEVLVTLYDGLVDDEDDVRAHGAKVASLVLSNTPSRAVDGSATQSLSPSSARTRLLKLLSSSCSLSRTLVLEAVWRLIGLSNSIDAARRSDLINETDEASPVGNPEAQLGLTSISELLDKATYHQGVVFEEENPNLYLDPVTEAEVWAQIIVDVKEDARPPWIFKVLRYWTWCGLSHLISVIDREMDSPLGLTSKADVYALFMQVILMARVVLLAPAGQTTNNTDLARDLPPTITSRQLTESLEELYQRGQKADLHPLILNRVRRILEEVGNVVE